MGTQILDAAVAEANRRAAKRRIVAGEESPTTSMPTKRPAAREAPEVAREAEDQRLAPVNEVVSSAEALEIVQKAQNTAQDIFKRREALLEGISSQRY